MNKNNNTINLSHKNENGTDHLYSKREDWMINE